MQPGPVFKRPRASTHHNMSSEKGARVQGHAATEIQKHVPTLKPALQAGLTLFDYRCYVIFPIKAICRFIRH